MDYGSFATWVKIFRLSTLSSAVAALGLTSALAVNATGDPITPLGTPLMMSQNGLRIAGFGDSRVAMWNHLATPTAIVRTNNVATVTLTSHGFKNGGNGRIFGVRSDASFNAAAVQVTRIDANNFSYPCPGPDATATLDSTYARVLFLDFSSNISVFQWANGNPSIRCAMRLVANFGQSSEMTSDMVARLAEVQAFDCDWVYYDGGVNDTAGTSGAAAVAASVTIANDILIVEGLLASGKGVFLGEIDALGSLHPARATAMPKIAIINQARRELAHKYHGRVVLISSYAATLDPTTGYARTNALQTESGNIQVHRTSYGAKLIGDEWARSIPWIAAGRMLTKGLSDARVTYATSPNLWPIGQFAQATGGTQTGASTNGSPAAGDIGGVMAGFNVTVTGATATTSIRPDLDDNGNVRGYFQCVQVTPTGAGSCTIQAQSTATMLSVNGVATAAGQKYRVGLHKKLTGLTGSGANNAAQYVQYERCRLNATMTGAPDSATLQLGTPFHSDAPAADYNISVDNELYVLSQDLLIPAFTTYTQQNLEWIVVYSHAVTAGSFEICVSLVTFDQVG